MPKTISKQEWKNRIGRRRLKELRELRRWSLEELSKRTGGSLLKSRLSNYEQGTRLVGAPEAAILGEALGENPAHILCLDDPEMPALSKSEAKLIADLRTLPENQRAEYAERISALALAYRKPISEARVMGTAYNPTKRPRSKPTPQARSAKHGDDD